MGKHHSKRAEQLIREGNTVYTGAVNALCSSGKKTWTLKRDAKKWVAYFKRKGKALWVYKCPECRLYHTTSTPTRTKQKPLGEVVMNATEAANDLGISADDVRQLLVSKKLKGVILGSGGVRVTPAQIKEFVQDTIPEGYLSLADAAEALGWTPRRVIKSVQNEKLPSETHYRRAIVSKEEIDKIVNPRDELDEQPEPEWMTVRQAVKATGSSESSVHRWCQRGLVESKQIKGIRHVSTASLRAYLEGPRLTRGRPNEPAPPVFLSQASEPKQPTESPPKPPAIALQQFEVVVELTLGDRQLSAPLIVLATSTSHAAAIARAHAEKYFQVQVSGGQTLSPGVISVG